MKLNEECKKNHEKERGRLSDTPTAKSQWCQLLQKKMCTGIYSSCPSTLKNVPIPSIKSLSSRHTTWIILHVPYGIQRKGFKDTSPLLRQKRKWPLWNFSAKSVYWEWRGRSEDIIFFLLQLLKHWLETESLEQFLCFMTMMQLSGFKLSFTKDKLILKIGLFSTGS